MDFRQFSRNNTDGSIPVKFSIINFHAWLFSNPCGKVLIIMEFHGVRNFMESLLGFVREEVSKRKCPSSQCPESVFQPGSQCVLCVTVPRQGVHLLAKHSGPLTDDMVLPTLTHLPYHSSSLPLTPPYFPSLHLTHLTHSQYSTRILTPTHASVCLSLFLTTPHYSSLSSLSSPLLTTPPMLLLLTLSESPNFLHSLLLPFPPFSSLLL